MDANLDKIAKDLYGKIQTRFRDIKIGDENAEVLSKKEDIPNARFFEFEYEENGEPLGTIAITLDAEDGIVIQVSGDLTNDDDSTTHHSAYKFIRGFRQFAKDRLLNFDVQNIGKSNLDKRDYEFQAKRKEEPIMQQPAIMENKLYGNNRMSYQDLGEARLVIKHSQPINLDLPAGRTMHVDSIYIENAAGERFKYPTKHINGARALAEHIKHGGNPYDAIGKHICGLSEELAHLRKFKGYVSRQEQVSEAMGSVTGRVIERIEQIKETIHKLQRTAYYESFVEAFEDQEEQMIPEEVQNDLINRLTIRTFNEELKSVFPYIYKFIDESEIDVVELSPDDLIGEVFDGDKEEGSTHKGGKVTKTAHGVKHEKTDYEGNPSTFKDKEDTDLDSPQKRWKMNKITQPEDAFESFMDDIVREDKDELTSPNPDAQSVAVKKLNDLLAQNIQIGINGMNAIGSLKGIIDDPEFVELLQTAPSETDLNDLVQGWVETNHEELIPKLTFPDGENPVSTPEPTVTATPEPAAVEPTASAEPAPTDVAASATTPAIPEPAPVAEAKDEDNSPPWDVDPKDKKSKPTTPGKHGQGYSQARHLARQGMAAAMKKAVKAGATLETALDFGHGVKTIQEILDECGMTPAQVGFDQAEGGLPGMLKYISGFYNAEQGNFPLGGMRVKIKVKKAFEDGEFGEASPDDLAKVIHFIDKKDPSGDEQHNILKLAGVKHSESHGGVPKFDAHIDEIMAELYEASQPKYTWKDIYNLNKKYINDPNNLGVGQSIEMPDGSLYQIGAGDSLSKIAAGQGKGRTVVDPSGKTVPLRQPGQTDRPVSTSSASNSGPHQKPRVIYPPGADEITKQRLDQERRIKNLAQSELSSPPAVDMLTGKPFTPDQLAAREKAQAAARDRAEGKFTDAELALIKKLTDTDKGSNSEEPGPDFIDRTVKKADEPIVNVDLPNSRVAPGDTSDTKDQTAEWDKLYPTKESIEFENAELSRIVSLVHHR